MARIAPFPPQTSSLEIYNIQLSITIQVASITIDMELLLQFIYLYIVIYFSHNKHILFT